MCDNIGRGVGDDGRGVTIKTNPLRGRRNSLGSSLVILPGQNGPGDRKSWPNYKNRNIGLKVLT